MVAPRYPVTQLCCLTCSSSCPDYTFAQTNTTRRSSGLAFTYVFHGPGAQLDACGGHAAYMCLALYFFPATLLPSTATQLCDRIPACNHVDLHKSIGKPNVFHQKHSVRKRPRKHQNPPSPFLLKTLCFHIVSGRSECLRDGILSHNCAVVLVARVVWTRLSH